MSFFVVGIAVASAVYSGYAAQESAKAQARNQYAAGANAQSEAYTRQALAEVEAQSVLSSGASEATNIKRQALQVRASLVSAQAASGTVIGEGSAQAAIDHIDTLASADALAALYGAADKATSTRTGGDLARTAGSNALRTGANTAASLNAAGNAAMIGGVLSGVAAGAKGLNTGGDTGGKK